MRAKLVRRISCRRMISLRDRSRMERSRGPIMRKRTAMFQQGLPGSRRSRYQKDCCARLVGKRYRGSPNEPTVVAGGDEVVRSLPLAFISRGLRRGVELVLLAGNARDLFELAFAAAIFRGGGVGFGGEGRNGSQSKDLLGRKGDADVRCAGNDLEKVNGVRAEIKQTVVHAHTVKVQNLSTDGGELCFRGVARGDKEFLLRKAQRIQGHQGFAINFSVGCMR